MKESVIYTMEVLVCSGLLLLAYNMLLERRVSFLVCRIHLLASTAAAMIIPLLDIPVWAAETVYVAPTAYAGDIAAEIVEAPRAVFTPRNILLAVYFAGTALSLALTLYQLLKIRGIRKNGVLAGNGRPRIVRASDDISSFSFFGTIYIGRDTRDEELQAIIAHESSHIAHHHSAERVAMELMKAAMWWNPFAWIAQRRLAEVHEYEADADVLRGGYDINNYIATILKSLLGYSPDIANGLRDSLTKKRFKMMTTPKSGRYALLRTLAVAPVVAGLLCTFSFTAKATDYRTDGAKTESSVAANQRPTTIRMAVTDEKGTPLGGVKVVADGKEHTADASGRLTFTVDNTASMELSREGYKTVSPQFSWSGTNTNNEIDIKIKMVPDKSDEKYEISMTMVSTGSGQNKSEIKTVQKEDKEAHLYVDKMPTFQGGDLNAFRTYVMSKVRYPEEAINKGLGGRVVASFTIDKQGKVTDVHILQSPDRMFSEQVIKILSQSPAWTPGEQDGETVNVKLAIPVEFRISGGQSNNDEARIEAQKAPNAVDKVVVVGFAPRAEDDKVVVDGFSEEIQKAPVK